MTLKQFSSIPESIPMSTSWYLSDIAEARGKQDLFTRQSPQRLKVLREHALIESAVSSNRIEGVEVEQSRIKPVILGRSLLQNRDEEEVRGYRNALKLIHEQTSKLSVSEETILRLHRLARGEIWDAGKCKERESDIIEKHPDGTERIRFKTVRQAEVHKYIDDLLEHWERCFIERWVHPLMAMAAFNLDFLCIHPFRDGNGRVSRLLLLLQCYHLGYEVGRYISLERLIEENKDRYYETLEESSYRWHEGKHNPWPYLNYLLFILKNAYREFEERVGQIQSPRGAKTELVMNSMERTTGPFSISDIQKECPTVSIDMIRRILKSLRAAGRIKSLGRGQKAQWQKTALFK